MARGSEHVPDNASLTQSLFDEMLEGFALHEIIRDDGGSPVDYRFLQVNDAFERLTGLRRTDILGRTGREVLPDDNPEWLERFGRVALTGQPSRFRMQSSALDLTYDVHAYSPAPGLFATLFIDVTEADRATKIVERDERLYRAVVESSADGFWMMDSKGTILGVNDALCALTGYDRAQLVGMNVRDLEASESPEQTADRIAAIERDGSALFETRLRAKDGTLLPVEVNSSYWPIEGGRYFTFFRDLVRRRRAEYILGARAELLDIGKNAGLSEILRRAIDKAELLTGSSIGFFHLVDPDQENLTLQTWSTNTLASMCTAEGAGRHYAVTEAGVWTESVRTRKPAIHNDYMNMAGRKGMPVGHSPVTRELVVPVIRAGMVVALMGVGNKATDYTPDDVAPVEAMANMAADMALHGKAQEEFERFFELVPEPVCIASLDGRFRRVNAQWERVLGYPPSELILHSFMEFVHPDDREATRLAFACELEGDAVSGFVNRYLAKDGSYRWLEWSATPLLSDGLLFAVARDITESRTTQVAAAERELRLRALLDNAPYGAHMYELMPDGRLVFIGYNARAVEMLGIDHDALIGRTLEEAFPGNIGTELPDAYRTVAREGGTWSIEQNSYDAGGIAGVFEVFAFSFGPNRVSVFFRDVTDLRRAEIDLQRSEIELRGTVTQLARAIRTMTALSACNEALVRAEDEQSLLKDICRIAVEQGGYLMAWVGYAEHDEAKTVRPVAVAGADGGYLDSITISWGDGPTGRGPGGTVIKTGTPVVISSIADDPRLTPWRDEAVAHGYRSIATFPLLGSDGMAFGAIMFYAGETSHFEEDEIALLTELSADLAYGIETLRAREVRVAIAEQLAVSNDNLEALLRQITVALGRVVEARDPYTSGHEERVGVLGRRIAIEMGMTEQEADGVEIAGLVHDIGKLSVPAEILTKPNGLSPIEVRLIHEHSQSGYEILKGISFAWPVADMVLQHHERVDGSGYPNGLTGEQMLPQARILAVADVVEAIASHRPYRAARGPEQAIAEVTNNPQLYDAEVANACERLYRRGELEF